MIDKVLFQAVLIIMDMNFLCKIMKEIGCSSHPDVYSGSNQIILLISGMKRLILDVLIGSELLSYRTEVLFLFVYRILFESNG